MRRDPIIQPFDLEADEASDVTSEFWGGTRSWDSREHDVVDGPPRRDDTTGSLRALRDGWSAFRPKVRTDGTGQIARTRQHGVVHQRPVEPTREATLAELASDIFDDDLDWSIPATSEVPATTRHNSWDEGWDDWPEMHLDGDARHAAPVDQADDDLIPLSGPVERPPLLGGVDPLLLRVGAVITALVLLVPLALSLRPDDAGAIQTNTEIGTPVGAAPAAAPVPVENAVPVAEATQAAPDAEPAAAPAPVADSDGADSKAAEAAPVAERPTEPVAVSEQTATANTTADSSSAAANATATESTERESAANQGIDDPATVDETAEREVPECPQVYTAGPGDSWYRIADAADVSVSALLDENRATLDTVIFPDDDICLPAGATMPEPPATTVAPTTVPATTVAPSTTAPPTTAPPTTTPASTGEVQQIIRDVWPDELEEKALQIAFRESRYVATAYNGWCCYGVFQIYWTVHRGWLDDFGIYSSSDLYDARKNTEAAYEIYRRAGGWGPWGG